MLGMRQKIKLNNWQGWTIIWLGLFIVPSLLVWYYSVDIYVITLLSIIFLIIYELVFIRLYLEKRQTGLRAQLKDKMSHYNPTDDDYDSILQKISVSATVISVLASVTFSLIVFLLGFIYLKEGVEIGLNIDSALIFGMLTSLIIAGICYLISLDQYDTAADPSFDVKTKWKMRQLALGYFVFGWYFLIFGIFIALSLIHPLLTLIGCCCYVSIHNIFWFQTLGYGIDQV